MREREKKEIIGRHVNKTVFNLSIHNGLGTSEVKGKRERERERFDDETEDKRCVSSPS